MLAAYFDRKLDGVAIPGLTIVTNRLGRSVMEQTQMTESFNATVVEM